MVERLNKGKLEVKTDQLSKARRKHLIIGVTGGTASGKTTLCHRLGAGLNQNICILSCDSFYKGLTDDEHDDAANYNFDHPNALDLDLAYEKLHELASGKDCEIPTYDFTQHKRTNVTETLKTSTIILFEGIHAFNEERFRDMMDLKIFALTPDDIRLSRRRKFIKTWHYRVLMNSWFSWAWYFWKR